MGHTGEGKARGKAGLPAASTSLSPAPAAKDGATIKGARWSAGSREGYFDSTRKQEPIYTSNTSFREFVPRLQSRIPARRPNTLNTAHHNTGLGRPSHGSQRTLAQQISDPNVPFHFPYTARATSVGNGSVGHSEVRKCATLHLGSSLSRTVAPC